MVTWDSSHRGAARVATHPDSVGVAAGAPGLGVCRASVWDVDAQPHHDARLAARA